MKPDGAWSRIVKDPTKTFYLGLGCGIMLGFFVGMCFVGAILVRP